MSPQLPEYNAKIKKRHRLSFAVLSDQHNAYADQLSLAFTLPAEIQQIYTGFGLDLPAHNGDDSWRLPMPARLVVDAQGALRSLDADPDYTVRPEPAETLEILHGLS